MCVQLERKQHGHFVREAWVKQVKEKQEEREEAEREQLEAMKEREAMQLAEEERHGAEREQRRDRAVALQLQLQQQVEELRLLFLAWTSITECMAMLMMCRLVVHLMKCGCATDDIPLCQYITLWLLSDVTAVSC
jgi:hypothetical protein